MNRPETEALDYSRLVLELVSGLVLELHAQGVVDLERLKRLVLLQQERVGLAEGEGWASSPSPELCGQMRLPFGKATGKGWGGRVMSQVEPSSQGGGGCGDVWAD